MLKNAIDNLENAAPSSRAEGDEVESFLKTLQDLPDWEVYREVAAAMGEAGALLAWRRLYLSHPERATLLQEGAGALAIEAKRRLRELVADQNDAMRAAQSLYRRPP